MSSTESEVNSPAWWDAFLASPDFGSVAPDSPFTHPITGTGNPQGPPASQQAVGEADMYQPCPTPVWSLPSSEGEPPFTPVHSPSHDGPREVPPHVAPSATSGGRKPMTTCSSPVPGGLSPVSQGIPQLTTMHSPSHGGSSKVPPQVHPSATSGGDKEPKTAPTPKKSREPPVERSYKLRLDDEREVAAKWACGKFGGPGHLELLMKVMREAEPRPDEGSSKGRRRKRESRPSEIQEERESPRVDNSHGPSGVHGARPKQAIVAPMGGTTSPHEPRSQVRQPKRDRAEANIDEERKSSKKDGSHGPSGMPCARPKQADEAPMGGTTSPHEPRSQVRQPKRDRAEADIDKERKSSKKDGSHGPSGMPGSRPTKADEARPKQVDEAAKGRTASLHEPRSQVRQPKRDRAEANIDEERKSSKKDGSHGPSGMPCARPKQADEAPMGGTTSPHEPRSQVRQPKRDRAEADIDKERKSSKKDGSHGPSGMPDARPTKADEAAKRKANEAAKRKAKEAAKRKAKEAAKRKAKEAAKRLHAAAEEWAASWHKALSQVRRRERSRKQAEINDERENPEMINQARNLPEIDIPSSKEEFLLRCYAKHWAPEPSDEEWEPTE